MKAPPTKPSWASLLQEQLAKAPSQFTPEHKSFHEIRAELKASGLPHGKAYTAEFIRGLLESGKATAQDGTAPSPSGRMVRATRYLIK